MASINEMIPLKLVLQYIDVKDLIKGALDYYNRSTDEQGKSYADILYYALDAFL